jgi:hypothetical protein
MPRDCSSHCFLPLWDRFPKGTSGQSFGPTPDTQWRNKRQLMKNSYALPLRLAEILIHCIEHTQKTVPYAIPSQFIPKGLYALRHIYQKPLNIAFLFNYSQKNTTRLQEDYSHGRYQSNRPKDVVSVDANEINPGKNNQQVRLPADP